MAERAGVGGGRRQMVVPAQSGRAISVSRGDLVRVVDIEGHQVRDMWAVDAADHSRWLSVSHTRDRCERLFPAVGGQFCDQRGTPVLELADDTSPGVHDMPFPPYDPWRYESRGLAVHPNCRDNFLAASSPGDAEQAGMSRPHVLFWGHEPRPATGWTDPERVGSFVYNTATAQGLGWRVPDAPFVMETFYMGDHGIVSGYRAGVTGQTEPVLLSARNDAAEAWGLRLYRSTLYAFCAALDGEGSLPGLPGDDVRPLVHQVMDAFWCHPNPAEALAWGAYPYDSDPAGTAIRPLARPFAEHGRVTRGNRAWLAGSLALSTPEARVAYLRDAPEYELADAPATDLYERTE